MRPRPSSRRRGLPAMWPPSCPGADGPTSADRALPDVRAPTLLIVGGGGSRGDRVERAGLYAADLHGGAEDRAASHAISSKSRAHSMRSSTSPGPGSDRICAAAGFDRGSTTIRFGDGNCWRLNRSDEEATWTTLTRPLAKTTVIDIPEAVGVFDRFEDLQQAYYDLRTVGFSRHDLSLLGKEEVLKEKLGKSYWRAEELEDDPPPRAPGRLRLGGRDRRARGQPRRRFSLRGVDDRARGDAHARQHAGRIHPPPSQSAAPRRPSSASCWRAAPGRNTRTTTPTRSNTGECCSGFVSATTSTERLAVEILKGHSGRDVHVHDWSE